jgi:hypothetical protein
MLGWTMLLLHAPMVAADAPQIVPSRFVADRVFVIPQTINGDTLTFFTDSGGGLFITDPAVKRLKLTTSTALATQDAPERTLAVLPTFKTGYAIPLPPDNDGKMPVMPAETVAKNHFDDADGMLGEAWFGGHVWTFDYPAQRLSIEGKNWKPAKSFVRAELGFPVENGERGDNFPRITIRVDGKPIDMLLDTGATTTLTAETITALKDTLPATRATSMIVDTQFQAWRKAHPNWRVIEKAQERTRSDMIEVPDVEIGGAHVGPVWFTWRPDKNFHEFMSSMMDKQVEGAIGGNALGHFVMTIDYIGGAAYFRCVRDCGVTQRR